MFAEKARAHARSFVANTVTPRWHTRTTVRTRRGRIPARRRPPRRSGSPRRGASTSLRAGARRASPADTGRRTTRAASRASHTSFRPPASRGRAAAEPPLLLALAFAVAVGEGRNLGTGPPVRSPLGWRDWRRGGGVSMSWIPVKNSLCEGPIPTCHRDLERPFSSCFACCQFLVTCSIPRNFV